MMSYRAPGLGENDEEVATVTVVATPARDEDEVAAVAAYDDFTADDTRPAAASNASLSLTKIMDSENDFAVLTGIFLASVVVFWHAAEFCEGADGTIYQYADNDCDGRTAYALAAGVVSAGLVLLYLALLRFNIMTAGQLGSQIFSIFLFVWWFFATCVGTFKEPFTIASNGFLCEWFCLFASGFLMYMYVPRVQGIVQTLQDRGESSMSLFAIAVASMVVLVAGSIACDDASDCKKEVAFSVACPVISLCVCAVVYFMEQNRIVSASGLFFLAIWWFVGVSVLTFRTPFLFVGNGFCGTWSALIASVFASGATIGDVPVIGSIAVGNRS